MGVEVKKGSHKAGSIEAPQMPSSRVGPTTYAEGGEVRQEKWEDYQPAVAEERAALEGAEAPAPVVKADGGNFRAVREEAAASADSDEAEGDESADAESGAKRKAKAKSKK